MRTSLGKVRIFYISPFVYHMIQQQGSNRVYTREKDENGKSIIRVVGTNREENRAFIYMARHFHELGLPVPQVYWVSEDEMSYTQEDLGDTLLFDHLEDITLLERAIRALAHVQITGAKNFDWSVCFPVPEMDERSVRWDLNYFKYCFLKGIKIEFSEPKLEDDFDRLVKNLLNRSVSPKDDLSAQRSVFCQSEGRSFMYRDFQSRNVMIKDGKPYFIDFQGGRRGPTQYDIASFLWQAKANFAPAFREHLIDVYLDELKMLQPDLDEHAWRMALPHFVLFRTLQVLGAYGYRGYFERKPHFLQSVPLALNNLREVLANLKDEYPYIYELADGLANQSVSCPQSGLYSVSPKDGLTITIYSFSFKKGVPEDVSGNGGGYVFDCRGTNNPGRYDEYKSLTGLDQPVIDFLEKDGEILTFLDSVYQLTDHHVARFIERGFTHLQVSFGCTGGQHRSVYCAEHLAQHLKDKYNVTIHLIHRERGINRTL